MAKWKHFKRISLCMMMMAMLPLKVFIHFLQTTFATELRGGKSWEMEFITAFCAVQTNHHQLPLTYIFPFRLLLFTVQLCITQRNCFYLAIIVDAGVAHVSQMAVCCWDFAIIDSLASKTEHRTHNCFWHFSVRLLDLRFHLLAISIQMCANMDLFWFGFTDIKCLWQHTIGTCCQFFGNH